MGRIRNAVIFLLLCAGSSFGQSWNINIGGLPIQSGNSLPASCTTNGSLFFLRPTQGWYWCNGGTYSPFASGSGITGSGTANTVAKFTGASIVGNSGITDNGTTVATSEKVSFTGGPLSIGTSAPTALSGFSSTDDVFGTKLSAFSLQLGPITSATTDSGATITLEPADGVTTGQNFNALNLGIGTDATQTKNFGTLRALNIQTFPQTSGSTTNLIGIDIANQATNTNTITSMFGIRVQSDTALGTANVTTNNAINILRTGFVSNPTAPSTITTDVGLNVGAPSTAANGTMTHHYGIQITGTHTGGTGNGDGWAFFDATAANAYQFGTVTTLGAHTSPLYKTTTNCTANGTAASPSVVSCSAAPSGAFSCATNASAGTCRINTTAVTANSNIFITWTSAAGTRLGVTCNTAPSVIPAIQISAIVAGTSFDVNAPTFTTNPVCGYYWVVN